MIVLKLDKQAFIPFKRRTKNEKVYNLSAILLFSYVEYEQNLEQRIRQKIKIWKNHVVLNIVVFYNNNIEEFSFRRKEIIILKKRRILGDLVYKVTLTF